MSPIWTRILPAICLDSRDQPNSSSIGQSWVPKASMVPSKEWDLWLLIKDPPKSSRSLKIIPRTCSMIITSHIRRSRKYLATIKQPKHHDKSKSFLGLQQCPKLLSISTRWRKVFIWTRARKTFRIISISRAKRYMTLMIKRPLTKWNEGRELNKVLLQRFRCSKIRPMTLP